MKRALLFLLLIFSPLLARANCENSLHRRTLEGELREVYSLLLRLPENERGHWREMFLDRLESYRQTFLKAISDKAPEEQQRLWALWWKEFSANLSSQTRVVSEDSKPSVKSDDGVFAPLESVFKKLLWNYEHSAIAILTHDGTVQCMGNPKFGGECDDLHDVVTISTSYEAFAALKSDGTVQCWGKTNWAIPCPKIQNAVSLTANLGAFVAITSEGTIHCWGDPTRGGQCPGGLENVTKIQSTQYSFAALLKNGTVVCWGMPNYSGECPGLTGIASLVASDTSYAALRQDKGVNCWDLDATAGDCTGLRNVESLVATDEAFAALRANGTVHCWGHLDGDCSRLHHIKSIYANAYAFVALDEEGRVHCWGDDSEFGTCPEITEVEKIYTTQGAFLAQKKDGTYVRWGKEDLGGLPNQTHEAGHARSVIATPLAFILQNNDGQVQVLSGNSRFDDLIYDLFDEYNIEYQSQQQLKELRKP